MLPRYPRLLAMLLALVSLPAARVAAQINTVHLVAPGVYFHEGDPRRGHSNNGWVIFEDYVVVIDANYPSGASIVLPKIKESSDKPVRFAFNTHHHGDHAYGNQTFADAGATLVATEASLAEMKLVETGLFGDRPGRWENSAKNRPDVAASKLKPASLLFSKELFFDDGKQRVELRAFGFAHTRGDAMAWLPKQKILFTGDACVNGPFNNVADGNIAEWIKTLELLKQLAPEKVCPGHGPIGGIELIVDQQRYFIELQRAVQALVDARKTPAEVRAALPEIATALKAMPGAGRYVPNSLLAPVQKVYFELTGTRLPNN